MTSGHRSVAEGIAPGSQNAAVGARLLKEPEGISACQPSESKAAIKQRATASMFWLTGPSLNIYYYSSRRPIVHSFVAR